MRGGYRSGAGRKKGYSGVEAEKARELIIKKLSVSLDPIVSILIKQAKKGDIRAIKELFDRAYGKVPQATELTLEQEEHPIGSILTVSPESYARYAPKAEEQRAPTLRLSESIAEKNGLISSS
jgi:hypothetical protein